MGERLGGRTKGTPNKATAKVRAFLDRVFDKAFADPLFEQRLREEVITGTIDTKLLLGLLAYYAGRPAQAIDHTVEGTVTLAQLVSGSVLAGDPDVDDGDDEDALPLAAPNGSGAP